MKKLIVILSVICLTFDSYDYRPVHIFMIGDSTMANKPDRDIPEYGWGQILHHFFNDSVKVENYAKNGRSSKSFIDEGIWDKVIAKVQKDDYIIIQFGHNDQKKDTARHTSPFNTYIKNLKKYIDETKQKGAIPILCSSIVRRHFNENCTLLDTHGDYLIAVRQVAQKKGVYFIDMEAKTRKLVEEMKIENSKQLFLHFKSGIYPHRQKGLEDNTHLSQLDAFTFSGLA